MSNMAPAHTLERGNVQVSGGGQVNVSQRFVESSLKVAQGKLDPGASEEELRELVDSLLGVGLFAPHPSFEIMGRVGVSDRPLHGVEVGLRYSGTTLKGDAKLQWLEWWDGAGAASVQIGLGHQFNAPLAQFDKIGDWSRTDLDLMVPFGLEMGGFVRAWLAPRLLWSHVSARVDPGAFFSSASPSPAFEEGLNRLLDAEQVWYAGANVGTMIGYRALFLAVELNAMRVFFRPEVLGERRDLGGWTFVPTGGLVLRF